MKNIKDLLDALQAGKRPVVTFGKSIDDKEAYAEPGMRGRALSCTAVDSDGVVRVLFDFEEFDAHNTPLESSNYYDKKQVPCLTAKQAGFYKPQEHLYFDLSEELEGLMELESDEALQLFTAFKEQNPGCTYVQWLERQLLQTSQVLQAF
jgi:hypothetical protein